MGFMSRFKKNKKETSEKQINDLIFEETVKEVLGIQLEHTEKRDSPSTTYGKGLTALAVQIRLQDPVVMKKFEEVYQRKKMEKLKAEEPEKYENYLLEENFLEGKVLEDGVYEITPLIGSRLERIIKTAKEILKTKQNINIVKIDFNGVTILINSTSDENEIIQHYYNSFIIKQNELTNEKTGKEEINR